MIKKVDITLIVLTFIAAVYIQGYRIGDEQIKIWDEASSAQNSVEMLSNKSFWLVRRNCEPEHYDVKPPVNIWLKIISFKFFGINEFSVRFPTIAAFWLLTLLFVFYSVKVFRSYTIAWLIILIMISCRNFMGGHVARHGDPDVLLTFFVAIYVFSYFLLIEKYPVNFKKNFIVFSSALTLAVYTKSIQGLAPVAGLATYTIIVKNGRKMLINYKTWYFIALTVFMVLFYYVTRNIFDKGYIKAVLSMDLGLLSDYPGNIKYPEFSYYWKTVLLYDMRLSGINVFHLTFPLSIFAYFITKEEIKKRFILFCFIGTLVFLLGHSCSVTKNEWYIVPIYVFLWPLLALTYYEIIRWGMNNIKMKALRLGFASLLLGAILFYGGVRAVKVFKHNYLALDPSINLYVLEREGRFIRDVKTHMPNLNNISVLAEEPHRQMFFYARKYIFEDSTSFKFYRNVTPTLLGDTLIISRGRLQDEFDNMFHSTVLFNDDYSRLHVVDSLKVAVDSFSTKSESPLILCQERK